MSSKSLGSPGLRQGLPAKPKGQALNALKPPLSPASFRDNRQHSVPDPAKQALLLSQDTPRVLDAQYVQEVRERGERRD